MNDMQDENDDTQGNEPIVIENLVPNNEALGARAAFGEMPLNTSSSGNGSLSKRINTKVPFQLTSSQKANVLHNERKKKVELNNRIAMKNRIMRSGLGKLQPPYPRERVLRNKKKSSVRKRPTIESIWRDCTNEEAKKFHESENKSFDKKVQEVREAMTLKTFRNNVGIHKRKRKLAEIELHEVQEVMKMQKKKLRSAVAEKSRQVKSIQQNTRTLADQVNTLSNNAMNCLERLQQTEKEQALIERRLESFEPANFVFRPVGGQTTFTQNEEAELVSLLKVIDATSGFDLDFQNTSVIASTTYARIHGMGKSLELVSSADMKKLKSMFTPTWARGFFERHAEHFDSAKLSRQDKARRDASAPCAMEAWYREVNTLMDTKFANKQGVLVLNIDETGVCTRSEESVMANRRKKTYKSQFSAPKKSDEKQNSVSKHITAVTAIDNTGRSHAPFIVVEGVRVCT